MTHDRTKTRDRSKNCDRCNQPSSVLYRVRWEPEPQKPARSLQTDSSSATTGDWCFVCQPCWPIVCEFPGYQYGGTWKAKKRK